MALDGLAELGHLRERTLGFLTSRSHRHHAPQSQRVFGRDAVREGQHSLGLAAAAVRVLRQVHLHERVNGTLPFNRGACINELRSVECVNAICVPRNSLCFIRLNLTYEMPSWLVKFGPFREERANRIPFSLSLRMAALADIAHPQREQVTNQFGRMKFCYGDHDGFGQTRPKAGLADCVTNPAQALRERGGVFAI